MGDTLVGVQEDIGQVNTKWVCKKTFSFAQISAFTHRIFNPKIMGGGGDLIEVIVKNCKSKFLYFSLSFGHFGGAL